MNATQHQNVHRYMEREVTRLTKAAKVTNLTLEAKLRILAERKGIMEKLHEHKLNFYEMVTA